MIFTIFIHYYHIEKKVGTRFLIYQNSLGSGAFNLWTLFECSLGRLKIKSLEEWRQKAKNPPSNLSGLTTFVEITSPAWTSVSLVIKGKIGLKGPLRSPSASWSLGQARDSCLLLSPS